MRRRHLLLVGALVLSSCGRGPATDEVSRDVRAVVGVSTRLPDLPAAAEPEQASEAPAAPAAVPGPPITIDRPVSIELADPATRVDPPLPSITLAFTGDNLIHSPLNLQALENGGGVTYDYRPMYADVAPILSAVDLAVCHVESPVAPPGEELSTFPRFGIPAQIAGGLASAGYDRCSTASNHALDRGAAGVDATVNALEAAGIDQSGMARTPEEAVQDVFSVGGIKIAHLSYTFSFNGLPLPKGEPWRSNLIDPALIIADAADARVRGAQIVIVSMHWGAEGLPDITSEQRRIAEQLTASGQIDLIVGHHVHVIQPIEQINGRWVVFGMGNFLSNMPTGDRWPYPESTTDGEIVEFTITEVEGGGFTISPPAVHPTWVDRDHGWVIRPVVETLADPNAPAYLRPLLEGSYARTSAVSGPYVIPLT